MESCLPDYFIPACPLLLMGKFLQWAQFLQIFGFCVPRFLRGVEQSGPKLVLRKKLRKLTQPASFGPSNP